MSNPVIVGTPTGVRVVAADDITPVMTVDPASYACTPSIMLIQMIYPDGTPLPTQSVSVTAVAITPRPGPPPG